MSTFLKSHARLIIIVALLSAAISSFSIRFFPKVAIYLWAFGAVMVFTALFIAFFWLSARP